MYIIYAYILIAKLTRLAFGNITYTSGFSILFTIIGKSSIQDHGNNEKEHQKTQFPQRC